MTIMNDHLPAENYKWEDLYGNPKLIWCLKEQNGGHWCPSWAIYFPKGTPLFTFEGAQAEIEKMKAAACAS